MTLNIINTPTQTYQAKRYNLNKCQLLLISNTVEIIFIMNDNFYREYTFRSFSMLFTDKNIGKL